MELEQFIRQEVRMGHSIEHRKEFCGSLFTIFWTCERDLEKYFGWFYEHEIEVSLNWSKKGYM